MIDTDRLVLKPLTYSQLAKYIANDGSLEQELKLRPSDREMSANLKDAFQQTILPNVREPFKNYLYSTLWTVILKEGNNMVGDICLVGEPNENGEVEIGYGTYPSFREKGYMTEAVGGMISWLKFEPGVKSIIAGTEKANPASFAVLKKNGFKEIGESEELLRWTLQLK